MRDGRVLSRLTQAGGVKRGMSLALPLAAAVAGAQTLELVALRVALAPGVANAVRGEHVLVVAAVCERVAPKERTFLFQNGKLKTVYVLNKSWYDATLCEDWNLIVYIYIVFELLMHLLLEVQVMRPLPSPRQVQSTTIQPWYGFSQVSPTT